jgi:hydrogenase-4 membrane subunit HyfE
MIEFFQQLGSYLMVIIALAISASNTLKQMIRLYRYQAMVLTIVALLTAFTPQRATFAVLAALPAGLALLVAPLLGRASLIQSPRGPTRLRDAPRHADLIWLQHGDSRLSGGISAGIDMVLIATAVLVADRLVGRLGGVGTGSTVVPSLAASIALLLQGLFTMSIKRDIIAQIVGLLVMEHGLFLAAVLVAPPGLATLFVISLFFYVLVTLTILLWILPELRRASRSIQLSDNSRLKG